MNGIRASHQPILVAEGVSKQFGGLLAVDGVDLVVWPGEVVALLGPNGAGKTTTIEMCEGFLAPDSGRVRILGMDPMASRDRLRPHLGVMIQGGGGYPGIRTGEMLELAASAAAEPLDTKWLLGMLGLAEAVRTKYRQLSGGQRQRLSLACALVGRPDVVFLDEPTEGLDPAGQQLVWDITRRLRADGVAIVLTTHAVDEAEQIADKVVIIDNGRIIAQGSPAEVTHHGAQEQLIFTASSGLNTVELNTSLGTRYTVQESTPGRYLVLGRISPAVVDAVTAWGAAERVLLSELHVRSSQLEQTFVELTHRELGVG
ncbi:ABC transporter ATP-binding protein [Mycolicibacterium hippocampi]|uniref:ABC transporter ATP-binding protein n=1 Tax=Mycolicibacterium hippocampi TaxID=659824 RepID=UPI0013D6C53C|nr:ABC transporter ATP-binding protein [Mycolicibacterium hippocampi]